MSTWVVARGEGVDREYFAGIERMHDGRLEVLMGRFWQARQLEAKAEAEDLCRKLTEDGMAGLQVSEFASQGMSRSLTGGRA